MTEGTTGGRGSVREVGVLDVLVFVAELAMLAALVVAGWRIGHGGQPRSGWIAYAVAIVLPVVAMIVWGRWLAPRAPRRLPDDARLAGKLALFVLTAVLLALGGLPVWAAAFGVVAVVVLCGAERTTRRRDRSA